MLPRKEKNNFNIGQYDFECEENLAYHDEDYTKNFSEIEVNHNVMKTMMEHPYFNPSDNIFIGIKDKNLVIVYPKNKLGNIIPFNLLSYQKSSEDFDRLYFFIRRFYILNTDSDRVFVIMYCTDRLTGNIERFEYYRSKSDGFFWRLCIKRDDIEVFDKGFNYISSTFVNIHIQNFISKNFDSFNINVLNKTIQCIPKKNLNNPALSKRIFEKDNISENVFFKLINELFPPVTYLIEYEKCISTSIDKLRILLKEWENGNSNEYSTLQIHVLKDLYEELQRHGIKSNLPAGASKTEVFIKFKKVLSLLFKEYFIIDEQSLKFMKQRFNIGKLYFEGLVYKVNISSPLFGGRYNMYYIIYENEQISRSLKNPKNKKYKNILHITPYINSINEFGLDERYVAAGAFINKIFDYIHQAPITRTSNDSIPGHYTLEGYTFIGDLTDYDFLPDIP